MDKLIITVAPVGAEVTKHDNPAVPYTPDQIAESAIAAVAAGASIVHLHAREDDGLPSQDPQRFKELLALNPHIKNPDKIFPGQKLTLPASWSQAAPAT
ncbi:MAG: 3-keto-5-aminohexanoate cleavage protein, partial [Candidatus Sericytochromatia bacterium]